MSEYHIGRSQKDKLDKAATLIWQAKLLLDEVQSHLGSHDAIIVKRTVTDLVWANENCTVMGLHQIGEALDDTMGETQ